MFFLVPRVTLVLLVVFAALIGWRMWRQRHGSPLRRGRRRGPVRRRRRSAAGGSLLPATLLQGAERTWVVFVDGNCISCRHIVSRLRTAEPDAQVSRVDCAREPRLAEAFSVRRHPTVLLANRYGQVEVRLVGVRAVGEAIDARR